MAGSRATEVVRLQLRKRSAVELVSRTISKALRLMPGVTKRDFVSFHYMKIIWPGPAQRR